MPNQAGKSYALNAITPMEPAATPLVRLEFPAIRLGFFHQQTEALIGLQFIHFARWVVLSRDAFPYFGPPQPRESLRYDYLLFCSNFNGNWENYIDAFSEVIPGGIDNIWRWSLKFPGARPVGPFINYIRACQYDTVYYYTAYPGASTKDILGALTIVDALDAFALESGVLSPDEFRAAYNEFLGEIQPHLGSTGPRD